MQPPNPNPAEEASLIARCRQGAPDAWDELFDRHYDPVARFVFQLAPDFTREDVEEVCQDVFLAAVRHLGTFKGSSAFQTWLFRIAVNKARDLRDRHHAAKRGSGRVPVPLDAANPDSGLAFQAPALSPDPAQNLMNQERWQSLRRALDELGDPCREIIELRYFGDLSYEELSTALGLNPKTVSSRLSKCLDRLAEVAQRVLPREESGRFPV